jgi:hypothetical protein
MYLAKKKKSLIVITLITTMVINIVIQKFNNKCCNGQLKIYKLLKRYLALQLGL